MIFILLFTFCGSRISARLWRWSRGWLLNFSCEYGDCSFARQRYNICFCPRVASQGNSLSALQKTRMIWLWCFYLGRIIGSLCWQWQLPSSSLPRWVLNSPLDTTPFRLEIEDGETEAPPYTQQLCWISWTELSCLAAGHLFYRDQILH